MIYKQQLMTGRTENIATNVPLGFNGDALASLTRLIA
jgi:hypothetical protein